MKKFKFNDLKIGAKLAISFLIVIIFSISSLNISLRFLNITGGLGNELFEGPYQVTNNAMGIRRDVVSIDQNIANALLEGDITNYKSTIDDNFKSLQNRIDEIKNNSDIDNGLVNLVENGINTYESECKNILKLINEGKLEDAKNLIVTEGSSYYNQYASVVDDALKLYELADINGIEFNEDINASIKSSRIKVISGGIFSIIISIIACIYLTKKLKKPIIELEDAAKKLSSGNFDVEINYEGNDELGSLADSIREMIDIFSATAGEAVVTLQEFAQGNFDIELKADYRGVFKALESSIISISNNLSDTISQINTASEEVGSASEQVASGAQMLSQGTSEQANAIEELSATIMDISDKIKETAKNAQEANMLSIEAGKEVADGNKQMKQMVNAMEDISFASNEIGRIIKTIDDIAFQTNILALNAAVEAARAGEAGKGFAVVADEVRNLAAKSAEAAKNTATLIENSIKAVENGTEIVDSTAKSLENIINTTNQTIELVDEIAKASEEEAMAISQVTLGLEQISSVVQTNSATSEESAAASEELNRQAQMLKSLIVNFKLKEIDDSNKILSFIE